MFIFNNVYIQYLNCWGGLRSCTMTNQPLLKREGFDFPGIGANSSIPPHSLLRACTWRDRLRCAMYINCQITCIVFGGQIRHGLKFRLKEIGDVIVSLLTKLFSPTLLVRFSSNIWACATACLLLLPP